MKSERRQYKGRQIELREGKDGPELRIDDVPVRYGQLPDGKFLIEDYAYDWSDDLVELAQHYIAYSERAAKVQEGKQRRGEA